MKNRPNELTLEEFREILSLPNHLIAIIRPDGTFHKVNEEATPLLGWEPTDVIGKSAKEYVHPEDWEETLTRMASVLLGSEGVIHDMRNRIRRKDGTWRWISWTGRARGGYIYAHGSDVTEMVEYEEALTVQALVLESISEGVIICNSRGSIVFANSAAEKLFGYSAVELVGRQVEVLSALSPEESEKKVSEVMNSIKSEKIWMGEFENLRKDKVRITTACRVTVLELHGETHFVCVQRDITRRKILEIDRLKLETRFRTFFEQSPLGMVIFDKQGSALEVNGAWERIFQVPKANFIGFNLFKDPFAISMGHIPYIERALAGEVVMIPPFFIDPVPLNTVPGARSRWLEVWFSPIKDAAGNTRELACILKDITHEVETRKVLEDLESKYRVASESLSLAVKVGHVGVWEWLPKEDRVIWDETTESIFGVGRGQFPGTTEAYTAHMYPDDQPAIWNIIQDSMAKAVPYTVIHRIVRKDGVIRWVQGSGMPFYDSTGAVIRILGTVIDITERKEQEEDQDLIGEISQILSSSFDYEQNIQKVMELMVPRFFDNAVVDEFRGRRTRRIAAASLTADMKKDLFEMHKYESEDITRFKFETISKEREVIINDFPHLFEEVQTSSEYARMFNALELKSAYTLALMGKNGPVGVVTYHVLKSSGNSISQRAMKLAREVAYRLGLALENSILYHHSLEAVRARDEFLSIASHELKTPLQSLTLQNEMRRRMIEKKTEEAMSSDSLLRALVMDRRQLTRINRLIDDMLDISRIRNARLSIQMEVFDLSLLLEDITERLMRDFESSGCSIVKEFAGPLEVNADSYRIEQVVVNLLINAMKYGAGSPIIVRTRKLPRKVLIEVEDKGPGIKPEDLERIFQRFERAVTGHEVSGLGLGLYISREIMELHHGSIHAKSDLGKGSTFIVEIPL